MPTESEAQPKAERIVPRYPFETRFKIRIERPEGPLETEGWARDSAKSGLGAFGRYPDQSWRVRYPADTPWVTALS